MPSVEKLTTQCKITGLGGRTQTKRAKDRSPKSQTQLERKKWIKRQRAKKRHQWVPMYYLYQWWASSSDTLIYPSIFAFPSLSLHRWSTPTHLCSNVTARDRARTTIALTLSDWSRLFDGHMTHDSHVFTSILSVSNVPPPVVWPITRSHTMWSSTFYSFAICLHSCLPFVFNLPVFTFHQRTLLPKPQPIAYMSLPQNWDFTLTLHTYFTLFRTISHHITLPWSHHLYLPQYTWRQSLTPRSHPLRAP